MTAVLSSGPMLCPRPGRRKSKEVMLVSKGTAAEVATGATQRSPWITWGAAISETALGKRCCRAFVRAPKAG